MNESSDMVNMAKTNVTSNAAVRRHPVLLVFAIITVVMVIVVHTLYPVARDYYAAMRENNRLEEEYRAIVERNEKIQRLIDALQTPEGIEDRARETFGWVLDGEKAVNIIGLDTGESSTGLPISIEPGSIRAQETWWTRVLDFVFGVSGPEPADPYPDDVIPGL